MKRMMGEVGLDGRVFYSNFTQRGVKYERWMSPEAYHNQRLSIARQNAKTRAHKAGVDFDLTHAHLRAIFPADRRCPALGTLMVWGGDSDSSPTLDRIVPTLGYVHGNVEFLSNRANRIKSNATTDEVVRVANYLKGKLN